MKKISIFALKGLLAGISIAFGGILFLIAMTYIPSPYNKFVGAILFPIGLSIVCYFSLLLFTGKIGLIFEKKQDNDFYVSLPIMYIFNIIGSFIIGAICYLLLKNTDIYLKVLNVASNKINFINPNSYFDLFIKAFLCGLCVYLAVRYYFFLKNKILKFVAIFIFISFFVYMGYEHCIANAFYFAFAMPYNPSYLINIIIVTLGNIIGTIPGVILFKGLGYTK